MKRLVVKASDSAYEQLKAKIAGENIPAYYQSESAVAEEVYDIPMSLAEGIDMQKLRDELKSASADKMAKMLGESLDAITDGMLEYADNLDSMVSVADGRTSVFVNFNGSEIQVVFSVNRTITRKM